MILFSLYILMCFNFPITVRLLQNNEHGFPLIFTITVVEYKLNHCNGHRTCKVLTSNETVEIPATSTCLSVVYPTQKLIVCRTYINFSPYSIIKVVKMCFNIMGR
jgi:hypothetical protein